MLTQRTRNVWLNGWLSIPRWKPCTTAGCQIIPATRQQQGFGGVLAFEVAGGREAAWQFINGTELMSLTANLGDAKTTIVHPASTTHGRLTPGQREAASISDGLVRIAVGREDLEDLQSDCLRGFAALKR